MLEITGGLVDVSACSDLDSLALLTGDELILQSLSNPKTNKLTFSLNRMMVERVLFLAESSQIGLVCSGFVYLHDIATGRRLLDVKLEHNGTPSARSLAVTVDSKRPGVFYVGDEKGFVVQVDQKKDKEKPVKSFIIPQEFRRISALVCSTVDKCDLLAVVCEDGFRVINVVSGAIVGDVKGVKLATAVTNGDSLALCYRDAFGDDKKRVKVFKFNNPSQPYAMIEFDPIFGNNNCQVLRWSSSVLLLLPSQ